MRKPKQPDRRHVQQLRKPNDLSRCLAPPNGNHILIAVVELSMAFGAETPDFCAAAVPTSY
jgi:hypothetical protein